MISRRSYMDGKYNKAKDSNYNTIQIYLETVLMPFDLDLFKKHVFEYINSIAFHSIFVFERT